MRKMQEDKMSEIKCNDCGEQTTGEFAKYLDKNSRDFVCWECYKKRNK